MIISPAVKTDAYKLGHIALYEHLLTKGYSTLVPRQNSYFPWFDKIVCFGIQMYIKRNLIEDWNNNFFLKPKKEVIDAYHYLVSSVLGTDDIPVSHFEDLHDLGYLPIKVMALPEGTLVPMKVPYLTIENTHNDFPWLTNFLETSLISEIYPAATAATTALVFRKIGEKYAILTAENNNYVDYQFHDFSQRGHHGNDASAIIGTGHITSFVGSDTIQAAMMAHNYYDADLKEQNILKSVIASEHSVMQAGTKEGEPETYRRLISENPNGILSLVSDTWDYWNVLDNILPSLKEEIELRDGKLVIRPDSGSIKEVIAGWRIFNIEEKLSDDFIIETVALELSEVLNSNKFIIKTSDNEFIEVSKKSDSNIKCNVLKNGLTSEHKGSLELLWETFGGHVNSKGYKVLSPKIGLLYGEGIHLNNIEEILNHIMNQGFSVENVVFGVGAYVYSVNNTRDSFGHAIKIQAVIVDGEERQVFKDPKTDKNNLKKSLKGKVFVIPDGKNSIKAIDGFSLFDKNENDLLRTVFEDGKLYNKEDFITIKNRISNQIL